MLNRSTFKHCYIASCLFIREGPHWLINAALLIKVGLKAVGYGNRLPPLTTMPDACPVRLELIKCSCMSNPSDRYSCHKATTTRVVNWTWYLCFVHLLIVSILKFVCSTAYLLGVCQVSFHICWVFVSVWQSVPEHVRFLHHSRYCYVILLCLSVLGMYKFPLARSYLR